MTGDAALRGVPCAHGTPAATGRLRTLPEDFRVTEVLGFEPDGAGAHMLLQVEKRGANTGWVAAQLARHAGVAVRDIGYSGHKDRHAVTQQAYTVPLATIVSPEDCLAWAGEGYRVIDARRHGRKLRPGSHRANRFELTLRELTGDRGAIDARLQLLAAAGVPNYFGPQRFGREGGNLHRAVAWAAGGTGPRDRNQRGFALSAARSFLFNTVLGARVARGDWNLVLPGEAVMLDGRRSFFHAPEIDASLQLRCLEMDVHPSGPLPGRGAVTVSLLAAEIEAAALAPHASLVELLVRERLEHQRRSLRLPVREFEWQFVDAGCLVLRFSLPRGAFATAVLHELLADAWDSVEGDDD